MSKKVPSILSLLIVFSLVLAACGAAPEPETVVETIVETVVETVEVEVEKAVAGEVFNIEVWAEANEVEHYRVTAPMLAGPQVNEMLEAAGDARRVTVEGMRDDAGWADYKKKFTLAAMTGRLPTSSAPAMRTCRCGPTLAISCPLTSAAPCIPSTTT
jgi:hypothetical protein